MSDLSFIQDEFTTKNENGVSVSAFNLFLYMEIQKWEIAKFAKLYFAIPGNVSQTKDDDGDLSRFPQIHDYRGGWEETHPLGHEIKGTNVPGPT